MNDDLVQRAEQRDYDSLFRCDLRWSAPDHAPIVFTADTGDHHAVRTVWSFRGVRV